jgi:peptide/nickel transport system permease protein
VDFEEFISIFTNGRGLVAQGPIPPGIFGYREGEAGINPFVYEWVDGRAVRRSLDEARVLMEQAGYPGGRDQATGRALTINYEAIATGPDDRARLNWIRKQFAKLGIELVIRSTDYNRFQEKIRNGTGQVFMWGWNADYPDPENFLFLLYGPNGKVEHQGENASNYANPEFDRLFNAMRFMDDGPERQAAIDRMVEIARTDAPWLWGFNPKAFSLHHRWMYNASPNQMANNTLKYRRVDPELRAQLRRDWNPPILVAAVGDRGAPRGDHSAGTLAGLAARAEHRAVTAYIIRRLIYAIPILIGVNLITFVLFFVVNAPDDMARMHLGEKRVTEEAIQTWKQEHGYDRPLLYNPDASGLGRFTETIFFEKSIRLFVFDFGSSDNGRDIGYDISQRMWPSLAIAIPVLLVGLAFNISYALFIVFFRATYVDIGSVVLLVAMMSISGLFYIIGGQFLLGKLFHLVPISGYDTGVEAWKFLILPVIVGVIGGIGAGTRWYRTLFLEEISKDYVRTARAKGLSERRVLFRHVLQNALIPILTGVVVVLPLLFMGSLITESFFGIPGLGSYTIDAINSQDFAIVRSMVFLGAVLYIVGLILTDISYTWWIRGSGCS